MVELRTGSREMRGYVGNHLERLELKIISCASQLTIPNTAGTGPDPAGMNTNTRSSNPNAAHHAHEFSYPLIFSILFPSSSSFSLSHPQLYHHHRTQS